MKISNIKLTEKEEEIMLRLWEYGPCSVKTIIDHLPEPKPHFNTVSTFVRILEQKGYVERKESNGRGFLYYAVLPKSSYRKNVVRKLVSDYFGSSFSMMSALVSDNEITPEQLRELLDMIEQK
ncbi:MAG: BlaI/MecI/CopY family transcriptional regulator [Muribaculaceae bacterium]|nr:BlaI/MecI/CopY family transcriptional regulator [Muribaculaceae bacterium]